MASLQLKRRRIAKRGSAMLVTMIVVGALIAGAATLTNMQVQSQRSQDLTKSNVSSLYCAEAGIAAARTAIAVHYPSWGAGLSQSANGDKSEPSWLESAIGSHDIDGDGVGDFTAYIHDNNDDPGDNNLAADNDLQVFLVVSCTKYPETPNTVTELVKYNGGVGCHPSQIGGCGGEGNTN
jgi:type II secretory pathway pseudopilin PulG